MSKDRALFNRDRLREARKEAGLSQSQAAALMQMARTTVVAIEKGERRLTYHELEEFARIYGVEKEWLRGTAQPITPTAIHINFGYSARERDPGDKCFYCQKKPERIAYTYFGAPVCKYCWDNKWRKGEDGATDPPFDEIHNESSGFWLK